MASQYGIKLAVYLVFSCFGDLVSKVCECLLRRVTLPWRSIVQFTELNPTQVKNSLLVLSQHNFVQAFAMEQEGVFGEAPKVVTQHMALFDNIIRHMSAKKSSEDYSNMVGIHLNHILDRHKATFNQSGDTTFVEKKETEKIMYKLWKDDYLHMEKIVASAGRQSQFLLWKVNKHSFGGHVLDEMYHAALNLRTQNAHEKEQQKRDSSNTKREACMGLGKKIQAPEKSQEYFRIFLDEAIMLFHHF